VATKCQLLAFLPAFFVGKGPEYDDIIPLPQKENRRDCLQQN
jgi:hypothetical protein